MAYQAEKASSNQMKLTFTVPAEDFDKALQQAYLKVRNRVTLPGFRKGKAPRKLIESAYGERFFYDEAFEALFPALYLEALKAEDINPVDKPEIDFEQIEAGKELKFSALVYVSPDVTLGKYKGLKANRLVGQVTEEQIDERIQQDVKKASTMTEVDDRAAQDGDSVVIDYAGSVDGVPFEGGTATEQTLVLGSNRFIPGFEPQVVGMAIGEEKDITVTFPEEYHAEELAGKDAVFHIKLHRIETEIKPELDDEFAKDVSAFDTFKAYREDIKKTLQEQMDQQSDSEVENNLIQQAADASDMDIPEAMVEDEIDQRLHSMEHRLAQMGMRFEDYMRYTGQDLEQLREMYRADAKEGVKVRLTLEAIQKAEKLEADEAVIDKQIDKHAKELGQDLETYKKSLNERQLGYFKELAEMRMVIDLLKDSGKITDKDRADESAIDINEVMEQIDEQAEKKTKKPAAKAKKTTKKEEKADEA